MVESMQERIRGQGQLEDWDLPTTKRSVSYLFDITTDVLARPGFPPVTTRRHSLGRISAVTGDSIREGYYRLYASDGEILKVQNVGLGQWVILAS
jgi:hypothetical protein